MSRVALHSATKEGSQAPRASGKPCRRSPNFGSSAATSPKVLSLWNLTAIQRLRGSLPDVPGSSPNFPGSSPDFPGGQPLSLGSLTPSPDSQKLSLIVCTHRLEEEQQTHNPQTASLVMLQHVESVDLNRALGQQLDTSSGAALLRLNATE